MFRRVLLTSCGVALLALSLPGSAAAKKTSAEDELWLHIRVEERGGDEETVRVNLPFALVEGAVPLIHQGSLDRGKVCLTGMDTDGIDLKQIWAVVREAKEGEFVTVEGRRETVRAAKADGYLEVKVRDGEEDVNIRVPLPVIDALLSNGENELDVLAAVRALRRHGEGEILTVRDKDSHVRIWVDRDDGGQ